MRPGRHDQWQLVPRDRKKDANGNANGNAGGNGMASNGAMNSSPVTTPTYPVCHPGSVPCRRRTTGTKTGTLQGVLAGWLSRTLHVPIQHEEDPMNPTLTKLDREWDAIKASPASRAALLRWGQREPALDELNDLGHLLDKRTSPEEAPAILSALARLAAHDELAARTLLQALVPGLLRLASTVCRDDPTSFEELVAFAWERIRTYPQSRSGSVAANVLWDVRKAYRRHRAIEAPRSDCDEPENLAAGPSAEETALAGLAVDDLLAVARESGVISPAALALILRTRVELVPLVVAAREQHATAQQANCIRWRAERRLRPLLAKAS